MKKILILLSVLISIFSYGQTEIKKSAISTAGGSHTNGTTTVISAIGEVAVQENNQGNIRLSEGFIGPDILTALGLENYDELNGLNIYPNPVDTRLFIEFPVVQDYEVYLYDLSGKQLIFSKINAKSKGEIDLTGYKTAVYMLIVVDVKNMKRKIVKINKL